MGATAAVIVASITLVGGAIAIGIYVHKKLENKKKYNNNNNNNNNMKNKKIQKPKIQKNDDNSEDGLGSSKVFTQTKTRLNDTYKDPLIPNTIDSNQNSIEIGVDCENKI